MALIKCPECGKEVSDKSSQCIHCGYPLKQLSNTICEINGIKYDLKDLYNRILIHKKNGGKPDIDNDNNYKRIFNDMYRLTHLVRSAYLCKEIYETEKVPEIYSGELIMPTSKPKCPHCNSTNISKISGTERAVSVIGLGILSNKIGKTYQCKNCKCTW